MLLLLLSVDSENHFFFFFSSSLPSNWSSTKVHSVKSTQHVHKNMQSYDVAAITPAFHFIFIGRLYLMRNNLSLSLLTLSYACYHNDNRKRSFNMLLLSLLEIAKKRVSLHTRVHTLRREVKVIKVLAKIKTKFIVIGDKLWLWWSCPRLMPMCLWEEKRQSEEKNKNFISRNATKVTQWKINKLITQRMSSGGAHHHK